MQFIRRDIKLASPILLFVTIIVTQLDHSGRMGTVRLQEEKRLP